MPAPTDEQKAAFESAVSGSGTFGAQPLTISQAQITVTPSATGTLKVGDTVAVSFAPATALPTDSKVWFDVSGFTGAGTASRYVEATWNSLNSAYELNVTIPADGVDGALARV